MKKNGSTSGGTLKGTREGPFSKCSERKKKFKTENGKPFGRKSAGKTRSPAPATLFSGLGVAVVQLPVALHVHEAHLGAGQQSADDLQPTARLVHQPVPVGQLGQDPALALRVRGQRVFRVLHVVHQPLHLVRRLFHVAKRKKHTAPSTVVFTWREGWTELVLEPSSGQISFPLNVPNSMSDNLLLQT